MVLDARVNFHEVDRQLEAFNARVTQLVKVVQAKIALDVFTAVIVRSPVDTGRFRGNWMLTIGETPSEAYDPTIGAGARIDGGKRVGIASAAGAKGQAQNNAGSLLSMEVGQVVNITNNTPYGIVLEAGHSDQAPQGVVLVSVLAVVERARRSIGGTF